jgi:branched-chain amino acid transport system substrate-binding protein
MRRERRLLLATLLLTGLFPLAGCKKSGGDEIVVGHYASLTGSTAHFGQDTDKAVRLAVDQINAAGGIAGKKIKVVTLDTRGDSAEAANAVARLIDVEKATAVIGEVSSSLSLAGGRVAQRQRIPMISRSSTNPKVTPMGDIVCRVCCLDLFQGTVMQNFARDHVK